jgi:hypothetical protein
MLIADEHKTATQYMDFFRETNPRRTITKYEDFILWVILTTKATTLWECAKNHLDPREMMKHYKAAADMVKQESLLPRRKPRNG